MTQADVRVLEDGGWGTYLPDWESLSVSTNRKEVGALTFSYPVGGRGLPELRTSQVAVFLQDGREGRNSRFVLRNTSGNEVSDGLPKITVTMATLIDALKDAQFRSPAGQLTRTFTNRTPGQILVEVMGPPAARGAFDWWGYEGYTFTETTDSNGVPWPDLVSEKVYDYGIPIFDVFDYLRENGFIEFGSDRGKIEAWVPDSRGVNRHTADDPVHYWAGKHLNDAPWQETLDDFVSELTLIGTDTDGNPKVYENMSSGVTKYGRREKSLKVSGVTDRSTLRQIGANYLKAYSEPRRSRTYSILGLPGEKVPMLDYEVGDTVGVNVGGDQWREEKVEILSAQWKTQESASAEYLVTVNDWLDERDLKVERMLSRFGLMP